MKDHLQRDHLNIVDGIKATYYDEDENRNDKNFFTFFKFNFFFFS